MLEGSCWLPFLPLPPTPGKAVSFLHGKVIVLKDIHVESNANMYR
jgi:hypothetical protein